MLHALFLNIQFPFSLYVHMYVCEGDDKIRMGTMKGGVYWSGVLQGLKVKGRRGGDENHYIFYK